MSVVQNLHALARRQVVRAACQPPGFDCDDVLKAFRDHFTDHSGRLKRALQNAKDWAWQTLEIALAAASSLGVNGAEEVAELEGQGCGDALDVQQADVAAAAIDVAEVGAVSAALEAQSSA
jgi:hypothetical protein